MSAWPATGSGPNLFNRKKLKLAMAVWGKNKHDLVDGIQRRHWNETAKRNAMGPSFETSIEKILAAVPAVLAKVAAELPSGFPEKVSVPILAGIQAQATRLAAMPE
jgi:serine/threonine-protein kinase HipA